MCIQLMYLTNPFVLALMDDSFRWKFLGFLAESVTYNDSATTAQLGAPIAVCLILNFFAKHNKLLFHWQLMHLSCRKAFLL